MICYSSDENCPNCGAPWVREVPEDERKYNYGGGRFQQRCITLVDKKKNEIIGRKCPDCEVVLQLEG